MNFPCIKKLLRNRPGKPPLPLQSCLLPDRSAEIRLSNNELGVSLLQGFITSWKLGFASYKSVGVVGPLSYTAKNFLWFCSIFFFFLKAVHKNEFQVLNFLNFTTERDRIVVLCQVVISLIFMNIFFKLPDALRIVYENIQVSAGTFT